MSIFANLRFSPDDYCLLALPSTVTFICWYGKQILWLFIVTFIVKADHHLQRVPKFRSTISLKDSSPPSILISYLLDCLCPQAIHDHSIVSRFEIVVLCWPWTLLPIVNQIWCQISSSSPIHPSPPPPLQFRWLQVLIYNVSFE